METNDWNDAERRVERAQELFEQHKWLEALDELRAATDINPYNASWYFNIGLTLDELGRYEEAIDAYTQALEIDGEDLQALHHLGLDLHQVGRFREALEQFDKAEQVDASFEPAYCARILTYTELQEHDRAEEMFYLARLYKDHCEQCYFNMGVSLAERGLHERAIYCFTRTLDGQDDWPEVHFRIAKCCQLKGDLEQSRRHYLAGLRQDPGNVESLLDLSELLIEMKRLDEAGEKIRHAIELAPEEPASYCCNGRWLIRRGRFDEAKAALHKSLELDPTYPAAHLHLGAIHLRHGELSAARKHLRSELLLRPEDAPTLWDLGNLLLDSGEIRAAVACFKRLTQVEPKNLAAWLNLGVAQFLRRRFYDGIASCEQALRLDPQNLCARFNLTLANCELHDFESALDYARQGLKLSPRDLAMQRLEFRVKALRLKFQITSFFSRLFRGGRI
ncbi:hypothetical protein BH09PLA1_BH09PLA1_07250 [soil metagenome]